MSIEDDLRRIYSEHPDMIVADCMNVLLYEQADMIGALRAEVERLIEANAHLDAVADQSFVEITRHIETIVDLQAENEELRAALAPDFLKVAVCEGLLKIDADDRKHPFIPPTAVDWMGNIVVDEIVRRAAALLNKDGEDDG